MSTAITLDYQRRPDIHNIKHLSRFQRMLLTTDGTVTEMLSQYVMEPIKIQKLFEKIEAAPNQTFTHHQPYIHNYQQSVLMREILLQGESSEKNWIHAESTIMLDHLSQNFRTDLLTSRIPIGRLWEKYRVETYKQIMNVEQYPAAALADHFAISASTSLICRTYSVFSEGKHIMIISETFPSTYFLD